MKIVVNHLDTINRTSTALFSYSTTSASSMLESMSLLGIGSAMLVPTVGGVAVRDLVRLGCTSMLMVTGGGVVVRDLVRLEGGSMLEPLCAGRFVPSPAKTSWMHRVARSSRRGRPAIFFGFRTTLVQGSTSSFCLSPCATSNSTRNSAPVVRRIAFFRIASNC